MCSYKGSLEFCSPAFAGILTDILNVEMEASSFLRAALSRYETHNNIILTIYLQGGCLSFGT